MKRIIVYLVFLLLLSYGCSSKPDSLLLEGDIQNNIISANSTVAGKITELNKQQGELVKKGDVIAVIDNTNQKYTVKQLEAIVKLKTAKLEELQAGTRPQVLEQAQASARAAKAQLDLLLTGNRNEQIEQAKNSVFIAQEGLKSTKTTYDFIEIQYNSSQQLFNEGALSKTELDNAKYKLDTAAKQVSTAEYQLESARQQLSLLQKGSTTQAINVAKANYDAANAQVKLLKSGPTNQSLDAAQADLDQSIAQLKQAENILSNHNIIALKDGIVISKNYELGDVVNVGSNICDIAIAEDIYVLCYIPDEYLDKVHYNMPLQVTTPVGIQEGRVSYIALKHEYLPKDKRSTSDDKHTVTKIKVAIKDAKGTLKSGMRAKVEIPLSKE